MKSFTSFLFYARIANSYEFDPKLFSMRSPVIDGNAHKANNNRVEGSEVANYLRRSSLWMLILGGGKRGGGLDRMKRSRSW